jgi:hypothetical protein
MDTWKKLEGRLLHMCTSFLGLQDKPSYSESLSEEKRLQVLPHLLDRVLKVSSSQQRAAPSLGQVAESLIITAEGHSRRDGGRVTGTHIIGQAEGEVGQQQCDGCGVVELGQ